MIEFLIRMRDRLISPFLRYRRWKLRRLKLRNIKIKWNSQQEHQKLEALVEQYGSTREIMDFYTRGTVPKRLMK